MIGVVLWSDPEEQKAVFWCEDHGDLAYFDAAEERTGLGELLHPGDMVHFDVYIESKVRRARNARVVQERVCNGLQDQLRLTARQTAMTQRRSLPANVIQMIPRQAQRRPA